MILRNSDYRYLRDLDMMKVFGELVRLNSSPYYHNSLNVIVWYEKITADKNGKH